MKVNVDLTEDRIFSHPHLWGIRNTFRLRDLIKKNKYPWDSSTICDNFKENKEIFFTGNKVERKTKVYVDERDYGNLCDCCGKDLTKKPWEKSDYLCLDCDSGTSNTNFILNRKPWLKVKVSNSQREFSFF